MVHLDQPRLQLCVKHDVEAQDLEAKLILHIFWLTASIEMPKGRVPSEHRFNDDISKCFLKNFDFDSTVFSPLFSDDVMVNLL